MPMGQREDFLRRLVQVRTCSRAATTALTLVATIRDVRCGCFVSRRALAVSLTRRGITDARCGGLAYTNVVSILTRLADHVRRAGSTMDWSSTVRGHATRALAPTIRKLRLAGFFSINAIARELNEREIPTSRGCKWQS